MPMPLRSGSRRRSPSPFTVQGYPVTLTASIGFSIFPTDTPERDQLLSNAKLAMHRGKSQPMRLDLRV